MATNPPIQTNAFPSPLPGPAGPSSPRAPGPAPAFTVLPPPRSPRCTADTAARPVRSASPKLIFASHRLPADVGPCLAKALEERCVTYRKELRRCQEHFSEQAVHELRVATRRLLAEFVLLSLVAPSSDLDKARPWLKRRIAALGDLRDTQVQLRFIDQEAARFPELEPMRAWLRRREKRLVKSAAQKIIRFRTKKLAKWITAITEDLAASAGNARARKELANAVMRATADAFAEVLKRRRAIDLADLGTIHQTRVAFKRFRYMVESLSPDLTGLTKRQLRTLAYYQRRMGIIQDLEVMNGCVEKFVHDHQETESALCPFYRYLRQRRTRAVRSFLKSADHLFRFWPTARLAAAGHLSRARKAA